MVSYYLEQEALEIFDGEVELDKSYFGGIRKGKRGCGAAGKMTVFGLLKRGGHVYRDCPKNCVTVYYYPKLGKG